MGLDLVVEGCPKPGHEHEWRRLLERSFADEELSETETARFQEICIPGYQRIGAPRVGYDSAANEWILKARKAKTPEEAAAVLKEFEGYYVVRLVECDGVPEYSSDAAEVGGQPPKLRGSLLSRLGLTKEREPVTIAEQREIVRAAGRWFVFWGERGHAIRAWF